MGRRPGADHFLPERVVGENERGHRFHHRHGAREDARVVATARLQHRVAVVHIYVAVGLNATRKWIVSPFEMPPWTPPLRFVRVRTRSLSM